jgi:hypothetical protein
MLRTWHSRQNNPRCQNKGCAREESLSLASAASEAIIRLAAELTPGVRAVVDNIIVQHVGSGWS